MAEIGIQYHTLSSKEIICRWLSHVKLSRIIILVSIVLIIVPLVTHYYLSKVEADVPNGDVHRTRSKLSSLEAFEDFSTLRASDLKLRIEEMLRIKDSVSVELRELEARRQRLQLEVVGLTQRIDELKQDLTHQQNDLERLKMSVEQAQVAQREAAQRNTPELAPPKRIIPSHAPVILPRIPTDAIAQCRMHNCFDHSRCSLVSGFPVYLYDPDRHPVISPDWEVEGFVKTTLKQTLGYNPHFTSDPNSACLYLVLVGESLAARSFWPNITSPGLVNLPTPGPPVLERLLHALPYWGGDGRNHILLNLARSSAAGVSGLIHPTSAIATGADDVFLGVDTGRAILVQSAFSRSRFRPHFDVIAPPILGQPGGDVWQECPPMLPARRRLLLSFQGDYLPPVNGVLSSSDIDAFIVDHLQSMAVGHTTDRFLFHFECNLAVLGPEISSRRSSPNPKKMAFGDWVLCGTESSRAAILRESTFVLIISPRAQLNAISTTTLQTRLLEALKLGAVPVILGGDSIELPYSEVLSWRRAALFLPKARVTELHFFLRTIPDADLVAFRRQGRLLWERYCASVQATVDTLVAVLRDRLGIPPLPADEEPAPSIFNASFVPLKMDALVPDAEPEESLGPLEPPYPSPKYKRNYTYFLSQGHEVWNDWGDPFRLYPQLPADLILPSDAKFIGSGVGFRPIGRGAGGAGKEFCESLGGNNPREQFTIVMLTYEREQVLINSLSRLYGLPYLHKVLVVWNSPKPPLEDLRWPDIGVPVHVVKANRNSLNNRFLPYEAIETEAVLSVDDDAHLRHDEIMFGFRVWREQRDRVVGFPGRYHAWDLNHGGWLYNSNYSCELSMVLTGAAFFHKYYTYLYSYWLPQAVRDKVDEYMNCEDIAMNFLVSHVTRKPPVKVTSRWTFRCPGCPVSLSEDDTHFQERHKCINFFTEVFGYMPLLNTQFRADSILFKTRIPHDKQKCFKFI